MTNEANGSTWTETEPDLGDARRLGQQEIRALRVGVRLRNEREHETYAASSAGGEHRSGSAKAYYESGEPSQRPDASTNLSSDDNGRLWIDSDTGSMFVYVDPNWVAVLNKTTADADAESLSAIIDGNAAGWTNDRGELALVNITRTRTVGSIAIEVEDLGGTFRIQASSVDVNGDALLTGSFLVPPGLIIRSTNVGGVGSTSARYTLITHITRAV